ncbi:ankyrin repeat-containing domain protein [Baffinella frigidus]|nr:ankyrin repeat-containing domain protein [Cryptophyta sp. CCMP2293]
MSLIEAVNNGTAVDIDRILTHDRRTINDPVDLDRNTAMHIAAAKGYPEKVKVLIWYGASRLIKNDSGNTAIMEAVYNGHVGIVSMLNMATTSPSFARIDDPMHKTQLGETVLMIAAQRPNYANTVEMLLFLEVNPCAVDEIHGQTALMMAINAGNYTSVRALTNTDQHCAIQDKLGNTALHLAMMARQCDVLSGYMITDLMRHTTQDTINITNNKALTVLHLAVTHRNTRTIKCLLLKGANMHISNTIKINGTQDYVVPSPLFDAVCNRNVRVVKTLLKRGTVDKYQELEARGSTGETPLIAALQYQKTAVASLLLDVGASVIPHCDNRFTALHWAAHWGYSNLCARIISLGGFNRSKNEWKMTPYDYADNSEDDEEHDGQDEPTNAVGYRNYDTCRNLLRHTAESTSERIQAFAQCKQDRLGAAAGARVLPPEILEMVHVMAHGKDA